MQGINSEKYVKIVEKLSSAFATNFENFLNRKANFEIFAHLFDLGVKNIPDSFQLKIIELQDNANFKRTYNENDLLTTSDYM